MIDKRVEFGPRLGAVAIDFVFFLIAYIIVCSWLIDIPAEEFKEMMNSDPQVAQAYLKSVGILNALAIIMLAILLIEALTGYTIGKLLLRIRPAHQDGRPGNIALYAKRAIFWKLWVVTIILSVVAGEKSMVSPFLGMGTILFFLTFVGGSFVALGDKRQALHDLVSKSAVFYVRDLKSGATVEQNPEAIV